MPRECPRWKNHLVYIRPCCTPQHDLGTNVSMFIAPVSLVRFQTFVDHFRSEQLP